MDSIKHPKYLVTMVVLEISSIKSLNLEEGKTFIFYEMKHKMRKKFGEKNLMFDPLP